MCRGLSLGLCGARGWGMDVGGRWVLSCKRAGAADRCPSCWGVSGTACPTRPLAQNQAPHGRGVAGTPQKGQRWPEAEPPGCKWTFNPSLTDRAPSGPEQAAILPATKRPLGLAIQERRHLTHPPDRPSASWEGGGIGGGQGACSGIQGEKRASALRNEVKTSGAANGVCGHGGGTVGGPGTEATGSDKPGRAWHGGSGGL